MLIHIAVGRTSANAASSKRASVDRANRGMVCALRRSSARDHRAVLNRGRRPGYVRFHVHGTEGAVRRWLDSHRIVQSRAVQGGLRDVPCAAIDGLTVRESVAVRHRYGLDVMRVHEIEVASVAV